MDEVRNGEVITGTSIRRSIYTQSDQGRKWNKDGIMRFIELWKHCNEYRSNDNKKKQRYHIIEDIIFNRERIWNENSSRKRRKVCEDDDNLNIEDNEDENEMERILQALVNGEGNALSEE